MKIIYITLILLLYLPSSIVSMDSFFDDNLLNSQEFSLLQEFPLLSDLFNTLSSLGPWAEPKKINRYSPIQIRYSPYEEFEKQEEFSNDNPLLNSIPTKINPPSINSPILIESNQTTPIINPIDAICSYLNKMLFDEIDESSEQFNDRMLEYNEQIEAIIDNATAQEQSHLLQQSILFLITSDCANLIKQNNQKRRVFIQNFIQRCTAKIYFLDDTILTTMLQDRQLMIDKSFLTCAITEQLNIIPDLNQKEELYTIVLELNTHPEFSFMTRAIRSLSMSSNNEQQSRHSSISQLIHDESDSEYDLCE